MLSTVPDVIFKTRVRDESIGGDNPFRWQDVSTDDIFKGKKIVVGTHGTFLCVLLNHYDKKYDYTFWNSLKMPAIVSIKLDEHGVVNSFVETKIQNIETELEHQKKRINICENGL
jgi:peroxiredoxin